MFLIVSGIFLVYKTNFLSPNQPTPSKNYPPTDQPNNPPQSPPKPDQKKNLTSKTKERIKQLLAENEFLLKTNPKLVPVPDDFIGELLEKGYNLASDIRTLFDWKLAAQDIPDLNSAKRIGVIKFLSVIVDEKKDEKDWEGFCEDLVVIAKETSANSNGPIVNIDGRLFYDGPEIPYIREIVTSVLAQETGNPNKWEFSYLYANGGCWPYGGKSAGTALYLALLSALHKKPLPNNLAATGELAINEQKVLEVGGIPGKIKACWKKGIGHLVLPFPKKTGNLVQKFFYSGWKGFEWEGFSHWKAMHYLVENLHDLKEAFKKLT